MILERQTEDTHFAAAMLMASSFERHTCDAMKYQ
jgi:hypothetical protein